MLRKTNPALRQGSFHRMDASEGVYAFGRKLGDETLVVVINASNQARNLDVPGDGLGWSDGPLTTVFGEAKASVSRGQIKGLKLEPRSGVVLKK